MRKWWLAAVTLALATPALANNEGSTWANYIRDVAGIQKGGLTLTWAGVICDDIPASGENCKVDFGHPKSPGQGDLIILFAPEEGSTFTCTNGVCTQGAPAGDCGAPSTFVITTGPTATGAAPVTGTNRNVATTSSINTFTTPLTNNWLALNTRYVPMFRYMFINSTIGATCTTNDILMFVYDDKDT